MKKGQGLSLTTIVIAAIALIVLVVLVAIFTGRVGGFGEGVGEQTGAKICDENEEDAPTGYAWFVLSQSECDEYDGTTVYGNFDDVPPGSICCQVEQAGN